MTLGLLTLADWLRSFAVTVAGMESTGVCFGRTLRLLFCGVGCGNITLLSFRANA
ncbi:MAG: hypothetical protein ACLP8S_16770 [Solirubrobacteraceae bacterium]